MAKKKKNRKKNNNTQKTAAPEELISEGKSILNSGKAKEAVKLLKDALKKDPQSREAREGLIEAYLLRMQELSNKNMTGESKIILKNIESNIDDLSLFSDYISGKIILNFPFEKSVDFYTEYIKKNGFNPAFEKIIASKMLEDYDLKSIEKLPPESALHKNFDDVSAAVEYMDKGQWDKALARLGSVGRKSPYSDIKMFCKGIYCHLNQDEKGKKKAFSMISENFLFKDPEILLETNENSGNEKLKKHTEELIKKIYHYKLPDIENNVNYIAKIVSPENPLSIREDIAEIIWMHIFREHEPPLDIDKRIFKLYSKIFSPEKTNSKLHKMFLFFTDFPVASANIFIKLLHTEFEKTEVREKAESEVYCFLAQRIQKETYLVDDDDDIFELMGKEYVSAKDLILDLVEKSVQKNRFNKKAYHIAGEFLSSCENKQIKKIESLMEKFLEAFPEDTYPMGILSDIYMKRNAFKKAEKILKKAFISAPHDKTIQRKYAASALKSVLRNIKDLNENPAYKTFEKLFSELKDPEIIACLIPWKIITHNVFKKDFDFNKELEYFDYKNRLRIIGLYFATKHNSKSPAKASKVLKKEKKDTEKLSSSEILYILEDIPEEFAFAYNYEELLKTFSFNRFTLLKGLSDSDFIKITEKLINHNYLTNLLSQLKNRVKSAKEPFKTKLKFYLEITKLFKGETKPPGKLYEIVKSAGPPNLAKNLTKTANRLADSPSCPDSDCGYFLEFFDLEEKYIFPEYPDDPDGFDDDFTKNVIKDLVKSMPDIEGVEMEEELIDELISEFEDKRKALEEPLKEPEEISPPDDIALLKQYIDEIVADKNEKSQKDFVSLLEEILPKKEKSVLYFKNEFFDSDKIKRVGGILKPEIRRKLSWQGKVFIYS
ncbi:MAG: hypothetical protein ACQEQS_08795 [Thermodesulfobacteriota bacterium]